MESTSIICHVIWDNISLVEGKIPLIAAIFGQNHIYTSGSIELSNSRKNWRKTYNYSVIIKDLHNSTYFNCRRSICRLFIYFSYPTLILSQLLFQEAHYFIIKIFSQKLFWPNSQKRLKPIMVQVVYFDTCNQPKLCTLSQLFLYRMSPKGLLSPRDHYIYSLYLCLVKH